MTGKLDIAGHSGGNSCNKLLKYSVFCFMAIWITWYFLIRLNSLLLRTLSQFLDDLYYLYPACFVFCNKNKPDESKPPLFIEWCHCFLLNDVIEGFDSLLCQDLFSLQKIKECWVYKDRSMNKLLKYLQLCCSTESRGPNCLDKNNAFVWCFRSYTVIGLLG